MARRKIDTINRIALPKKIRCLCCNDEFDSSKLHDSNSILYRANGKLPYCPNCIMKIYDEFLKEFIKLDCESPEKKAMQRLCMALDIYYSDKIFESAVKETKKNEEKSKTGRKYSVASSYLRLIRLSQHKGKDYETTIENDASAAKAERFLLSPVVPDDYMNETVAAKAEKFFGTGFSHEDYIFLQKEYDDWTSRNECQTKSQEEIFKGICFTQLELLKATRTGADTKEIKATLLKQMEAGKLQPKQNSSDALSDAQTFGTLIDKWENTRPIPEIEDDLKDVDKIGLELDVFYRGHLAKFMGLKNGLSKCYDEYMKQYTVEREEVADEEDTEAIFDKIFGSQLTASNNE